MVQRSPSHFATGTFYWAHVSNTSVVHGTALIESPPTLQHEKMCVIDEAVAFMGGLDLCFGRWDTPQHIVVDDADDPGERIWPGTCLSAHLSNGQLIRLVGKDYSNPR